MRSVFSSLCFLLIPSMALAGNPEWPRLIERQGTLKMVERYGDLRFSHPGLIESIRILPDKDRVASLCKTRNTHSLHHWNLQSGEHVAVLEFSEILTWSVKSSGNTIVVITPGEAILWDISSLEQVRYELPFIVKKAALVSDSTQIVAELENRTWVHIDLETGSHVHSDKAHDQSADAIAVDPAGKDVWIVSANDLFHYDPSSGKCVKLCDCPMIMRTSLVPSIQYLSPGKLHVKNRTFHQSLEIATGRATSIFRNISGSDSSISISPDGSIIVVSGCFADSLTPRTEIYEAGTMKQIMTVNATVDAVDVVKQKNNTELLLGCGYRIIRCSLEEGSKFTPKKPETYISDNCQKVNHILEGSQILFSGDGLTL